MDMLWIGPRAEAEMEAEGRFWEGKFERHCDRGSEDGSPEERRRQGGRRRGRGGQGAGREGGRKERARVARLGVQRMDKGRQSLHERERGGTWSLCCISLT